MNYDSVLSERVVGLKPSGIRRFFDLAATMEGVISLGVGEPDFSTPWSIRKEAIDVLERKKIVYTANAGMADLRKSIAGYLSRTVHTDYDPEHEIVVTVGGSEAIDIAIRAVINPGDEVLVVEPAFVCYDPLVRMACGVPVAIPTKAENHFKLTAQELREKITDKTKLLILPYPNNPTGGIMEREDLEAIAEVIKKHDLMVLSDEIYSELTYEGKHHVSIASIDGMQERTVVINGFSKAYAMTGWRLGYALAPKEICAMMVKLHQFCIMSAPTTAQYAAIEALKNGNDDIEMMKGEYDMRRRFVVGSLNEMGLTCFNPEGAFYCFPCIKSTGLSSDEFCTRLLQSKHVALVPGSAFGDCGEGYVRLSYCYSIKHLRQAMKLIKEFLKELKDENNG